MATQLLGLNKAGLNLNESLQNLIDAEEEYGADAPPWLKQHDEKMMRRMGVVVKEYLGDRVDILESSLKKAEVMLDMLRDDHQRTMDRII